MRFSKVELAELVVLFGSWGCEAPGGFLTGLGGRMGILSGAGSEMDSGGCVDA